MESFTAAAKKFLDSADWLTDLDEPMVVALKNAGEELDAEGVQAALLTQYRMCFKELMERKPTGDETEELDELEADLESGW